MGERRSVCLPPRDAASTSAREVTSASAATRWRGPASAACGTPRGGGAPASRCSSSRRARAPSVLVLFVGLVACNGGESSTTDATATTSGGASTATTATASSNTTSASTSTTSTTTGALSSTTDDSAGASTGCAFLGCTDEGPACDAPPGLDGVVRCSQCDLWAQDCPEGDKCTPWASDGGDAWNSSKCATIDPDPKPPGAACLAPDGAAAGDDDCDLGALCWDVDEETDAGLCVALCAGGPDDPSCAAPGAVCVIANEGALPLCLPSCHPLEQGCSEGQVCAATEDVFACVPDVSGDGGAFAEPCAAVGGCDPGLACVAAGRVDGCVADGCCSPVCDTAAPNTCPGDGQECIPWYEAGQAPPGYENVGLCGIP
ncbi:MAG: hypothetical protein R3A79_14925 [Nannocystaceae bacterium]